MTCYRKIIVCPIQISTEQIDIFPQYRRQEGVFRHSNIQITKAEQGLGFLIKGVGQQSQVVIQHIIVCSRA